MQYLLDSFIVPSARQFHEHYYQSFWVPAVRSTLEELMIKRLSLLMAMILCGAYPLMAQRPEEQHPSPQAQPPHAQNPQKPKNGHIPPPPTKRASEPAKPQGNAPQNRPENRTPNAQENRAVNQQ